MTKFRGAQPTKSAFSAKEKALPKLVSENDQKPLFSFEHMPNGSGFSISCAGPDDRSQLASKLYQLSQMTWMQINQAPRHGSGSEIIARAAIKAKVPPAVTDDTNMLAFRYSGKRPMVGYRDGRTFHVLWLDWNFTLYDHG